MSASEYVVIVVYSTSYALWAERVLREAEIPSKLIPVPRRLSSTCGVCVRIETGDREAAARVLEEAGLEFEGIHEI